MKQLFLQKGKVSVYQVPSPTVDENNVLVQVYYSFISSGTEAATLKASGKSLVQQFAANSSENVKKVMGALKESGTVGTINLLKGKLNSVNSIGYSCSGKIIAVGDKVGKFKIGDYVACAGAGLANHAQIVSIPKNLVVKIRDKSFLKQASLTTIGSIAMQGIRRANLKLGERVCVLGLGLIGQITAQLAKLSGCEVFGIDLQNDRLELSKKLGTDFVFNPQEVNVKKEIDFATNHYGVDTTIITAASTSGQVITNAMDFTRRKGKVVLVGDVKLDFNREPFYSKEIDFLISCSYGPGRYDSFYELEGQDYPYSYVRWTENRNMELFVDLIQEKKIQIDPLVSLEFDMQKASRAYNYLKNNNALGIVLSYRGDKNQELIQEEQFPVIQKPVSIKIDKKNKQKQTAFPYQVPTGKLKTSFIGVGGFAKIKLLPMFSQINKVKIHSVIDTDSANLINVARLYNAKRAGNDYRTVLVDEDVDLAIIATPHFFHSQQALDCLYVGKAVFVEKPAAVTFSQLNALKEFFEKNNDSLYCVDFNRSFAPFNLAIKKVVSQRKNPLMIQYRMNAGFIPKDHWIQSFTHKGRIIGEACHIFELFCFLTDSKPISVSVQSLNHNSDNLAVNDNLIVQVGMSDGSCCSLTYTATGNASMGKERMEIFFDGKSIVMDDYEKLKGYGLPSSFNKKKNKQDKGHKNLLEQFIKAAKTKGAKSPISVDRIIAATELSLIADKLARSGGGYQLIDN